MKFRTIVFWDMNEDGGSSIPVKGFYQLPDLTGITQKNTDGRNCVMISLLFYIIEQCNVCTVRPRIPNYSVSQFALCVCIM